MKYCKFSDVKMKWDRGKLEKTLSREKGKTEKLYMHFLWSLNKSVIQEI
mgnify:CR=1 FL=1